MRIAPLSSQAARAEPSGSPAIAGKPPVDRRSPRERSRPAQATESRACSTRSRTRLSCESAYGQNATRRTCHLRSAPAHWRQRLPRSGARDFSAGDRIQFTAPDKQLAVSNRDLAVIESISLDGRIAARLDNNRGIEFNAIDHSHLDHGYAVTSHSSQGLTAERVLIHADTGVHPDLLSSRFGYVAVSRASHEATIFTNDAAKLRQQLGTEITKTSALEISQSPSVDQGLGIA